MNKPTEKQIEAEIEKLRTMKPTILRKNAFGDDHHEAIEAQIEALEKRWTEDDVFDELPSREENEDGVADNVHSAAREAAMWMAGDIEDGAPSNGWKELIRK